MDSIIKTYLEILKEDKNYFGYQINDRSFQPFEYNKVFCCASAENKDTNHILNQLNLRTNKNYTLNDIFIVVKRGIDKFLDLRKTIYKDRIKKSFHIISKSYPDFKVPIEITINRQKDLFRYLENTAEFFYQCDYICFIYTVLETWMYKKPLDDELYVENNKNISNINNIYVD